MVGGTAGYYGPKLCNVLLTWVDPLKPRFSQTMVYGYFISAWRKLMHPGISSPVPAPPAAHLALWPSEEQPSCGTRCKCWMVLQLLLFMLLPLALKFPLLDSGVGLICGTGGCPSSLLWGCDRVAHLFYFHSSGLFSLAQNIFDILQKASCRGWLKGH